MRLLLTASLLLPLYAQAQEQFGQTLVGIQNSVYQQYQAVASDPRVLHALDVLLEREPAAIEEQIRITEIPAPPFMEQARAA
ncbi:MAG: hypothetical protein RL120_16165 [Gammaproteobacteria bacterium]